MTVRRLRPDETALFKTLRLRALADAPGAFAHTHAEIPAKPDSYWQEMTRSVTETDRHVMFVAEESGTPIGMAFGTLDPERAEVPHLGGMWVDPTARARGIGRARGCGFGRIALWVTEGNEPAIALYQRMGFAATGRRDRLPANPALGVVEMERTL